MPLTYRVFMKKQKIFDFEKTYKNLDIPQNKKYFNISSAILGS